MTYLCIIIQRQRREFLVSEGSFHIFLNHICIRQYHSKNYSTHIFSQVRLQQTFEICSHTLFNSTSHLTFLSFSYALITQRRLEWVISSPLLVFIFYIDFPCQLCPNLFILITCLKASSMTPYITIVIFIIEERNRGLNKTKNHL